MQTPTKHRTAAEWAELFLAFEQSQQTQTDFCQTHGINAKYFSRKRRVYLEQQSINGEQPTFVRAVCKEQSVNSRISVSAITLCHAQTTLQLPLPMSPSWLAQLLKELAT